MAVTIDVEHDCPPFLNSYKGIEEGLPALISLLKSKKIPSTFFVTGDVARKYPETVKRLVEDGHEIGCHGDFHHRLDQLHTSEAAEEIRRATETLRKFYPVKSFRAPCLQFPDDYLNHLADEGYEIDSSLAKHKNPFLKIEVKHGIRRIPVTTTSILLRTPPFFRNFFLSMFSDPVVFFFHPWEFIDMTGSNLRFDCRYNTGEKTLRALAEIIDFYRQRGATFKKMIDL